MPKRYRVNTRIVGKCAKTLPCTGLCKSVKKRSAFRKRKDKVTGTQSYNSQCKQCECNAQKARYEKEVIEKQPELIDIKRAQILLARIRKVVNRKKVGKCKTCTKCGDEKDLSEFYPCGKLKNGSIKYTSTCIICNNEVCKLNRRKRKAKKIEKDARQKNIKRSPLRPDG